MRNAENIQAVAELQPDYMGFIFFAKSKRFVGEEFDEKVLEVLPSNVQKVGVFVHTSITYILEKVNRYSLQYVQLHSGESPELCHELKEANIGVIKVFSVGEDFDFRVLEEFEDCCDYFLFDAKGKDYGGNGTTFNWQVLENYPSQKSFFLSGGIGLEELPAIANLQHLNIHALDVNSRFEISPALKDVEKMKSFKSSLEVSPNSFSVEYQPSVE